MTRGIAIGPILFVIAILAVLVGAISSGSGGSGSDTSPERARALASQIINQAVQVKNAVDLVRAKGCADTEISFENGVVSGYTNQSYEVPDESLMPAMGGALYIGDDLECTAERQDIWRYGDDKTLYLCSEQQWRRIDVTGGDK